MSPIIGYRELADDDVDAINAIKQLEKVVSTTYLDVVQRPGVDQRWAAIARTDLERGFMALVRSLARPTSPFDEASDIGQPE